MPCQHRAVERGQGKGHDVCIYLYMYYPSKLPWGQSELIHNTAVR